MTQTCDKLRECGFTMIKMIECRQRPFDARLHDFEVMNLGSSDPPVVVAPFAAKGKQSADGAMRSATPATEQGDDVNTNATSEVGESVDGDTDADADDQNNNSSSSTKRRKVEAEDGNAATEASVTVEESAGAGTTTATVRRLPLPALPKMYKQVSANMTKSFD